LTQAKEETAKQQSRFKAGEISKVELEAAESAAVLALTTAQKASAKRQCGIGGRRAQPSPPGETACC
jgi:hypothetical protein